MNRRPSGLDLWERERKRERQIGLIVTGILTFFAIMSFSQDALACDILGGILVFCAGCCCLKSIRP